MTTPLTGGFQGGFLFFLAAIPILPYELFFSLAGNEIESMIIFDYVGRLYSVTGLATRGRQGLRKFDIQPAHPRAHAIAQV